MRLDVVLDQIAETHPDKTAFGIVDGSSISYSELVTLLISVSRETVKPDRVRITQPIQSDG